MDEISLDIGELYWDRDWISGIAEGEDGHVFISEIEMINATNYQISGAFWLGGKEYGFLVEMGDNNGFVWREITDEGPIPDARVERTRYALAPRSDIVQKHLQNGSSALLIGLWESFLEREQYKDLIGKYEYDRMFQPGSKIESHYRAKAAEVGFEIVSKEDADATRARLIAASTPAPIPEMDM